MAINPFPRIQPLDLPTALPSAARPDPSVWSNLASIGDVIGEQRERTAMGEILRGAVDAQGNIDLNKAATAIALSGRDPTRFLSLLEAQSRAREAQEYRKEGLDIARQGRDIQRQQLETQGWTYEPPDDLTGRPGGYRRMGPGGVPEFRPAPPPAATPAPAPTPAPQSALPSTGPTLASFDPEEAPPYRVAGPPTPPPQPPATAAPAAAATPPAASVLPKEWEASVINFPPAVQATVRGLLNYERDPYKVTSDKKQERDFLLRMQRDFPGWNPDEFARREERRKQEEKLAGPPAGEVAARTGLARGFLDSLPQIRSRLENDELNTVEGRIMASLGQGRPGELTAAIDEGADALLRGLTGAGMPETEAARYQRRYGVSLFDTKETQLRKLNGLEKALRFVNTEVGKGRGGDDFTKAFRSQFGEDVLPEKEVPKVKNEAEANKLIGQARDALRRDPARRDEIIKRLRERNVPNPELLLGQ